MFVQAPSRAEQRRRLEARGSETAESLARRLARAEAEEELGRTEFDAVVVNHEVEPGRGRGRCYPGRPPRGPLLSCAGLSFASAVLVPTPSSGDPWPTAARH